MSFTLAILLCALSFAHFFVFWKHFGYEPLTTTGDGPEHRLESVMYLHISSAPHFVIFSTRLTGYFWVNLPSPMFAIVIIGTQIVALLMVVFGGLTPKIPFSQAIVILLISFVYFIFLDIVKVQMFKMWSFELTAQFVRTPARRKKLAERMARKKQQVAVWKDIDKIREVVLKLKCLEALNEQPREEGQTMEDPQVYEEKQRKIAEEHKGEKAEVGEKEIKGMEVANAEEHRALADQGGAGGSGSGAITAVNEKHEHVEGEHNVRNA